MEPILDVSCNKRKVPIVVWGEGSATAADDRSRFDEICLNPESNHYASGNFRDGKSRNGQADLSNGLTGLAEEVKFVDSKGRILTANDSFTSINTTSSSSSSSSSTKSKTVKKKHKVPDGGWGWVVVFSSFIISMVADGISFSFGLLYIEFLNYFQESKSKTSWVGSLFMAVPLLSGPIMSALVDRYGCRSMTMLGGFISGMGFVIASLGNSVEWEFVFFGVVAGIGLGLCYVTAVVSIAYWFDKYRTLAMGLGACGSGVGTFVYAPLTQFLIEEYGWRGTVLLLAGTFFNVCVCGALMRDPEWLHEDDKKEESTKSLKTSLSFSSIRSVEEFIHNTKNEKSNEHISVNSSGKKVSDSESVNEDNSSLPSARSVVNLPTFIKQREKVPLEVLEHLRTNKTMFNVILESYPSLLNNETISGGKVPVENGHGDSKPVHVTVKPLTTTTTNDDGSCVLENISCESRTESPRYSISNPMHKNAVKSATPNRDSSPGQHYLRDIRLHRNSVMYRGAMMNIPRYRLRASSCPDIFRNSMTTLAKENEEKWYADALELCKTMCDFSMFVELHFLLMSVATILLFIWLIVPYFYLAEHVTRHGYSEVEASFLLSIIGVANCLGMVGLGWAGDQPWMNVTKTYAACLTLCGLSCIFMPLTTDRYNVLAALSALFGLFFASNYSFTPSIVVQLIPLERFTTAYGLILLCQGIGCLVGPPLAGWIFDMTGEWDLSFYLAGGWIMFSAILTIMIQYTKNRKIWGSGKLEMERVAGP